MELFLEVVTNLSRGFIATLSLFALTLALSLPLGLLISFLTMSRIRPVKYVAKIFVWILRGTPLMLQIFAIFYLPGLVFGWTWPRLSFGIAWVDRIFSERFIAALAAFVINYAAYFSEIFRGGIQSVSEGQYEAGQVLGLTRRQTFKNVILLQVIKRIIPPMSNEIITLVKDTSLANTIIVCELIYEAKDFMSEGLIWPLFAAGGFYLIFVGLLTVLLGRLERRLDYFKA